MRAKLVVSLFACSAPFTLESRLSAAAKLHRVVTVESASRITWADVPHWGQQAISKL